jgi:hypothetical protein
MAMRRLGWIALVFAALFAHGTVAAFPFGCPNGPDADGDGLCDDVDPCTNVLPVLIDTPRLTLGRLGTPLGDNTLRFTGTMTVPVTPTIDPRTKGVRVVMNVPFADPILDATVPGGDEWGRNAAGTAWSWHDRSGQHSGLTRILLRQLGRTPGHLAFIVEARFGRWAVSADERPSKVTLVIDSPVATTGQCGEARFSIPRCTFGAGGATLRCVPLPRIEPCTDPAPNALVECEVRNAAAAEEAYFARYGTFLSGTCADLPGFVLSPGIVCTAVGTSLSYAAVAAHPSATEVCVWSSAPALGQPNLTCN